MASITKKELQEQLAQQQEMTLQTEIQLHKINRQLQESFMGAAAQWGEPFNPYEQFLDFGGGIPPFGTRYDYRSKSYLFFSETQLHLFRAYARYLAENNSFVSGVLDGLRNFVIKKGFIYVVQPKRNKEAGKELIDSAQAIIDEFQEANNWKATESNLFTRSRRDGEAFVQFFPQDNDEPTQIRIVEPEWVRCPDGSQEFSFGIKTPENDREKVLAYYVTYSGDISQGEEVSPEEIHHIKCNVDVGVKRGMSDLFSVYELVEHCKKLLRAEIIGETIRSSIAYIKQFQQASLSTVQALQQGERDFDTHVMSQQGTRNVPSHRILPGEVPQIPKGFEFVNPPMFNTQGGTGLLTAGLQALAAKWQVPSWMVSGEGSSASYSSSLTEESPFSRSVECSQEFFARHYDSMMTKVLEIAVAQRRLPESAMEVLDVQVVVPSVITRQKKEQSERHLLLHDSGILSKRSWSALEDVDYTHEQNNYEADEPNFEEQPVRPELPNSDQQPQSPITRKAGDYKS